MFLLRVLYLNLDIISFIVYVLFMIICRIGVEKGRKLFKFLLMRCFKNKKEWTDV